MKRLLILSLAFITAGVSLIAQVSKEEAADIASSFLQKRHNRSKDGRRGVAYKRPSMKVSAVNNGIYAVKIETGGFVLVANSDKTYEILGYNEKGSFDTNSMPSNVKAWMEFMGHEVEQINRSEKALYRLPETDRSAIEPMTTSKWNQGDIFIGDAFNFKCPVYSGYYCYTGCVATAMAQLMYYHKWPQDATTTIPAYTSNSSIGVLDELEPTVFQWDEMLDEYIGKDLANVDSASAIAVGTLMRYCGQGAKMNYGPGGSSASNVAALDALKNYFGYNINAYYADRSDYSPVEWDELIYSELKAKRPVLYSGQSTGGGHAFICDGYDGEGMYHINWGWGGNHDGYYLLNIANPGNNDGTGASQTEDGYSFIQSALIGVQPTEIPAEPQTGLTAGTVSDNGESLTIDIRNLTGATLPGRIYFGYGVIDDEGNVVEMLQNAYVNDLGNNYGFSTYSLQHSTISNKLDDGIYKISAAYSNDEGVTWQACYGSDKNYAVVTVADKAVSNVEIHPLTCEIVIESAEITTTGYTGIEQELKVTFKNNTAEYYNGTIAMFIDDDADYTNYLYTTSKHIAGVYLNANASDSAYYYFTPETDGEHTLYFWAVEDKVIGGYYQHVINHLLGTAKVSTETQTEEGELTATIKVNDIEQTGERNYLLQQDFGGQFTISNTTRETKSGLYFFMFKDDTRYSQFNYSLKPHKTMTFDLNDATLDYGKTYTFLVYFGNISDDNIIGSYTFHVTKGIKTYSADGTMTELPFSPTVEVPDTACSADFSQTALDGCTSFSLSDNPNCLYHFATSQQAPEAFEGSNVVVGGKATTLTVTPGHDFYTPVDFTAQTATYTTSFTGSGMGSDGWSTLVLPFTASQVACGDSILSWFTSPDDKSKNFWLYQFLSQNDSVAHFGYVSGNKLNSGTPYLIAVPDTTWGEKWNLGDKPLTFSGSNVEIHSEGLDSIEGTEYVMHGTFRSKAISSGYVLNDTGSEFSAIGDTPVTVSPFTAYFTKSDNVTSESRLRIVIDNGTATGIKTPFMPNDSHELKSDDSWYSLQGIRVSHPTKGIYIHNGRKVVIK